MRKMRIRNINDYPFEQKFKDQVIRLKPNEYIDMEYFEGVEFLGKYSPRVVDFDGQDDPRYFKKLRREEIPNETATEVKDEFRCMSCGRSHVTEKDLEQHIDEFHLDEIKDQEVAKERRSVGRPPKVKEG